MRRLSDEVARLVESALRDTEMPAVDRDDVEWEVVAAVGGRGEIIWLAGVGLPVKLTGNRIMPFGVLSGPDDPGDVARTVKALYGAASGQVAEETARVTAASNGHGKPPGRMIVP